MTEKDYEKLATVLQGAAPGCSWSQTKESEEWNAKIWQAYRKTLAERMADMLAMDNPAFNRARFLRACEPGANVKARTPRLP